MLMHMPSNIYSLTQDILFHVQFKKKKYISMSIQGVYYAMQ